jgi:hypothetical protein
LELGLQQVRPFLLLTDTGGSDMNDLSYWFVLVCLLLLGAGVRFMMFSRLKSLDPELWRRVGEPSVLNGNVRRHLLEAGYLLRARYLDIHDRKLSALSIIYSLFYVAIWLLFFFLLMQQWVT